MKDNLVAETVVLSRLLDDLKMENDTPINMGGSDSSINTPSTKSTSSTMRSLSRGGEFSLPESSVDLAMIMSETCDEIVASRKKASKRRRAKNVPIIDHFGDKGIYTGELAKGDPSGYGVMIYDDNRIYQGEWRNGRYHGSGKLTFANGDVYTGSYIFDSKHGKGQYLWKDGRSYEGEFCDDVRDGVGTYRWPDGSQYVGSFSDGKMHGYGVFTLEDGTVSSSRQWYNGQEQSESS